MKARLTPLHFHDGGGSHINKSPLMYELRRFRLITKVTTIHIFLYKNQPRAIKAQ